MRLLRYRPDRPEAVACLDPLRGVLPRLTSSLIRSKITTLASAATPMESTMPAIPGSVTVMGMITIRPQQKRVDEQGDIGDDAERPVDDEQQEKHEPEPDERGQKPALQELRPSVGPTVVSEITCMLTGSAPVLSTVSSCLASSSGRPWAARRWR